MDDIGKVNSESPTLNFIPSTIERVNGIFIVKVVPSSCLLFTSIEPPTFSILLRTMSMPTPLPENSVIDSFVEKPGVIIKELTSSSVYSLL